MMIQHWKTIFYRACMTILMIALGVGASYVYYLLAGMVQTVG